MNLWFWYALDTKTRTIVYWKISWNQTSNTCKKFLKELEKTYGKRPGLVGTDRGTRYKIIPRIGFVHEVASGGMRSYVERVIETVKVRTRMFDNYFPNQICLVCGICETLDVSLFILFHWI